LDVPRSGARQSQPGGKTCKRFRSGVRRFIFRQPERPADNFEREFIMQNPAPPPWGPEMEQEFRDRLTANGFHVTRCSCVEEHSVLQLRMGGAVQLTPQEVTRRIRTLARELGQRITSRGLEAYWRGGRFDGAFVMVADFLPK